jgi:hypothetical protein
MESVITAVKNIAAYENTNRYGGKPQLEVESPKLEHYEFQGQPRIAWHSGIPNNFCAFSFSFDDNSCAAYVYVFEEANELKRTLRVSNCDGASYADLPTLEKSLNDVEIANSVVKTLVAATQGLKAYGSIEQFTAPEDGVLASQLDWYSNGGL